MQSAALPYRYVTDDKIEVLLVTSRRQRRWILPKGKVASGMLPHRSAAREAMEEAGVIGYPEDAPIGEYVAVKRSPDGGSTPLTVRVFALAVTSELERWKEDHQRRRLWMPLKRAMEVVDDPGIRQVLRRFSQRQNFKDS